MKHERWVSPEEIIVRDLARAKRLADVLFWLAWAAALTGGIFIIFHMSGCAARARQGFGPPAMNCRQGETYVDRRTGQMSSCVEEWK